jgi:hypothetical protein
MRERKVSLSIFGGYQGPNGNFIFQLRTYRAISSKVSSQDTKPIL